MEKTQQSKTQEANNQAAGGMGEALRCQPIFLTNASWRQAGILQIFTQLEK